MKMLIAILVLLIPVAAFASGEEVVFPKGASAVRVQMLRAGPFLLVPVRIAGKDAGLFLWDTGSNVSVIDPAVARKLGLRQVGKTEASAVGGKPSIKVYAIPDLSIGGVSVRNTFFGGLDFSRMRKELGPSRLAGFIGGEFMSRMPFTLNWQDASVALYDPAKFAPPKSGERVSMHVASGRPMIRAELGLDRIGWFVLDTGSNSRLSLSPAYARANMLWLLKIPWHPRTTVGMGGVSQIRAIHLPHLSYLGMSVSNVAADYATEKESNVPSDSDAGVIGMPMLEKCEVTFDYARKTAWVKKHADKVPSEWKAANFNPRAADLMGVTPLMRAAQLGKVDAMKRFLAAGADPKAKEKADGWTALHFAAASDDPDAVKVLIDAKADLNAEGHEEQTPLAVTALVGKVQSIRLLTNAGAKLELDDVLGRTPLIVAAERGDPEIMAALLKAGADVKHVSRRSGSALMAAAFYGHAKAVKELLDAGADANEVDRYKHVPVILTGAMRGNVDVVRELIAHGAKVNALNGHGQTALMAAAVDKPEIVALLLKNGADRHIHDEDGHIAFDFAAAHGNIRCMTLLYDGKYSTTRPGQ